MAQNPKQHGFVDNFKLILRVQIADISTRCSTHPQGKSEARCENDGNLKPWLLSLCAHAVQVWCRGRSLKAASASAAEVDPTPNFFMVAILVALSSTLIRVLSGLKILRGKQETWLD